MLVDNCGNDVLLAYIKSDEVSFLYNPQTNFLGRLPDKVSSTISSHMTALFTRELLKKNKKGLGIFYTDLLIIPSLKGVIDYFVERQLDGYINQINSYAHHFIGKEELVNSEGTLKRKEIITLLKEYDSMFNHEKNWRKYGALVHRKTIHKKGERGKKIRRRIIMTRKDLGLFKDGSPDLETLLIESMTPKIRENLRSKNLI
jgi:tRNA(His) 5'-end guanylyltransferase